MYKTIKKKGKRKLSDAVSYTHLDVYKRQIIIGGGAAGMMAGVFAARNHHEVHILEKNEKLGKKVFITGKGRRCV